MTLIEIIEFIPKNMLAHTLPHPQPHTTTSTTHSSPVIFLLQSITCKSSSNSNCRQKANPHYPTTHTNKLYTPTIYDSLSRVHNCRNNSLYTLCSALHIYQQYCQIMRENMKADQVDEDMGDGMEYYQTEADQIQDIGWHGSVIAEICYQISQDINQSQNKHKRKPCNNIFTRPNSSYKNTTTPYRFQNKNKINPQIQHRKLHILSTLDWHIHYTTFIDITYQFFHNYQNMMLQYMGENRCMGSWFSRAYESREKQLEEEIENEIEIVLEQWVFLHKSPMECALITIERVLGSFGFKLDTEQLKKFMDGQLDELPIQISEDNQKFQQNNVLGGCQTTFYKQQVFKQLNRVNSSISSTSSSSQSSFSQSEPPSSHIENNSSNSTPPTKLAQFRQKITLSQKTTQYFKPFPFTLPSSPQTLNTSLQANAPTRKQDLNEEYKSEASTRPPSFQ